MAWLLKEVNDLPRTAHNDSPGGGHVATLIALASADIDDGPKTSHGHREGVVASFKVSVDAR